MITTVQQISNAVKVEKSSSTTGATEVMNSFQSVLENVNQEQLHADQMIAEMAAGRNKDIPGTMIAMEKAETSLKMLMSMRNKAVSAYQEIMRMQM